MVISPDVGVREIKSLAEQNVLLKSLDNSVYFQFNLRLSMALNNTSTRREFLSQSIKMAGMITLPEVARSMLRRLEGPVKLGVITDLHQDIMHDGFERLNTFVEAMQMEKPAAILQMGDFAVPRVENKAVIELFNQAHKHSLHVLGNHDMDLGHTKEQCLASWRMPAPFYSQVIEGLRIIVLDGNDAGSPTHRGGYPSFVGPLQLQWLQEQLASTKEPVMIVSHQPLAGTFAVDNAPEVQTLLGAYASKIILAINGHTHIDDVLEVHGVIYIHVNSASYVWVGESFKHFTYADKVIKNHPLIAYTCPYAESVFATLTIDPATHTIQVKGRETTWVGPSPAELKANTFAGLVVGEQIAPRIRSRVLQRGK